MQVISINQRKYYFCYLGIVVENKLRKNRDKNRQKL